MVYSVSIGNIELCEVEEEEGDPSLTRVIDGVAHFFEMAIPIIHLPDAPTFPNEIRMTRSSNKRFFTYHAWEHFCRGTGLYPLFFDEKTKQPRDHPGLQPIDALIQTSVRTALEQWQQQHPGTVPGFSGSDEETLIPEEDYDYTLARLLWFDWWISWAIAHCPQPGIENH